MRALRTTRPYAGRRFRTEGGASTPTCWTGPVGAWVIRDRIHLWRGCLLRSGSVVAVGPPKLRRLNQGSSRPIPLHLTTGSRSTATLHRKCIDVRMGSCRPRVDRQVQHHGVANGEGPANREGPAQGAPSRRRRWPRPRLAGSPLACTCARRRRQVAAPPAADASKLAKRPEGRLSQSYAVAPGGSQIQQLIPQFVVDVPLCEPDCLVHPLRR